MLLHCVHSLLPKEALYSQLPGLWKCHKAFHIPEMQKCQGLIIIPDNKFGENDRKMLDVRNVITQVKRKGGGTLIKG